MLKKLFDRLGAALGLVLLSPILIFFSTLVFVKLGRPIFFKQNRAGLHGSIFEIYKFRTMTDEVDADGVYKPDSERLTKLGSFMRDFSIDELPGLFCVLKGDMSLVGPRPLLVDYLPLYTPSQTRRHEVLPGLTGWAQINGRNAISWEEKFRLDVWYVDNQTFPLDMKILLKTLFILFLRKDISSIGEVSGARFTGSSESSSDS